MEKNRELTGQYLASLMEQNGLKNVVWENGEIIDKTNLYSIIIKDVSIFVYCFTENALLVREPNETIKLDFNKDKITIVQDY